MSNKILNVLERRKTWGMLEKKLIIAFRKFTFFNLINLKTHN